MIKRYQIVSDEQECICSVDVVSKEEIVVTYEYTIPTTDILLSKGKPYASSEELLETSTELLEGSSIYNVTTMDGLHQYLISEGKVSANSGISLISSGITDRTYSKLSSMEKEKASMFSQKRMDILNLLDSNVIPVETKMGKITVVGVKEEKGMLIGYGILTGTMSTRDRDEVLSLISKGVDALYLIVSPATAEHIAGVISDYPNIGVMVYDTELVIIEEPITSKRTPLDMVAAFKVWAYNGAKQESIIARLTALFSFNRTSARGNALAWWANSEARDKKVSSRDVLLECLHVLRNDRISEVA